MSVAILILAIARCIDAPRGSTTKLAMSCQNSGIDDVRRDASAIGGGGVSSIQRQIRLIDAVKTPSHSIDRHLCILLDVLDVGTLRQGDGVGLIKLGGESLDSRAKGPAKFFCRIWLWR